MNTTLLKQDLLAPKGREKITHTVRQIIDGILAVEGSEYTDNPADSGGPTKYGITLATLSAWRGHACTAQDVQDLERGEAYQIYEHRYYYQPGFDRVANYSVLLAEELTDSGVNLGPGRPSRWLQRCLNVLNNRGTYYADIGVDGAIGPNTERALAAYIDQRGAEGEQVLFNMLNALQGAKYIELAERREKDETFVYGWFRLRVGFEGVT